MRRIRKGDEVVVITGKDKGKRGNIMRVMPDGRVVISDVNMAKRHTKPNPGRGVPGGIIEKEMSIDASNVMLYNPQTSKGDRIGFRTLEDGRKVRYFKSTSEVVDI